MNDEAEVRLLRCSEFVGYRWIVGNVVLVREKHQGAATARGQVLILYFIFHILYFIHNTLQHNYRKKTIYELSYL